ncbi:MAG: NTP/NDP exchange transporter [Parachlamydiales bacterium]|nr:NTP/NDP exchange transporter [Parachlamydiales bacterium]
MNEKGFSKIRSFLWPIHRHELIKFVPILILFFLISFNYHILKILKDTLIITAKNSGAEVIPFLKVWAILPSAILLTYLFTKLSSKFNRENIFYVMMSIFLGFFVLFIFVLYPKGNTFNLNNFADLLTLKLPSGFKGFIAIVRYWHFSLFYIMAEAWSTIMLSLLLWVFVVDVLAISEAKRFYAFFGTSRNLAGVLSGILGQYLATKATICDNGFFTFAKFFGCNTAWDQTMFVFMTMIILCGIAIMILYRFLHVKVFPKRHLLGGDINKKGKQKISFKKSILYAVKSKYVLYITIIVLSYNILINLTEVLWKSQLRELHPSSSAYTAYNSKITYLIGMIAAFSSFFVSGNLVRRLGWKITALVTPITLMLTGIGFFYFLFLKRYADNTNIAFTLFGLSPLALAVFFGSFQNVFSRALKYTVFDDTKEMAFIPLSSEEKLQGKSAIDGIGSRLGKSGSSFLMQILIIAFATPIGASPYILGIVLLILPIWIIAINRLSKKFEEKTAVKTQEIETT